MCLLKTQSTPVKKIGYKNVSINKILESNDDKYVTLCSHTYPFAQFI